MKVKVYVKSSSGGNMGEYEGEGDDECEAVVDALQNGDGGQSVSLSDGDRMEVEVCNEEEDK